MKARHEKLAKKIRQAEQRERELKQRNFLKLARKHGLLNLEIGEIESKLAKISDVTESEPPSDTVATATTEVRTPATEVGPETAPEPSKRKWGLS